MVKKCYIIDVNNQQSTTRSHTMINAESIAKSKTWLIRYSIPPLFLGATNVMAVPADSEEKAIDYFKRIYCNPEKVVSYRFVESLGNSLKNLDKTAVG